MKNGVLKSEGEQWGEEKMMMMMEFCSFCIARAQGGTTRSKGKKE